MMNVRNLSVTYPDGTRAIKGLDLRVARGENVALIGANGAGKTSLLLALVGVTDSAGLIEIDGIVLSAKTADAVRARVGLVFQNPDDQLFMPDIYSDVAFGPRNFGVSEAETRARTDETLRLLGIEHLRARSPLRLSGGEKRVAAIAAVLVMRPTVLLFDEPTAFLDPRARRRLVGLLNRLPLTKLIATHDLRFAAETCDRAVLLQDGAVIADEPIRELIRDEKRMTDGGLEAVEV